MNLLPERATGLVDDFSREAGTTAPAMAALSTAWNVPLAVRKALTSIGLSSTALILPPEAGIYGKDCLSTR